MPSNSQRGDTSREPLVSYRAMFDAEVRQAMAELRRPWMALLVSGVIAGAGVGASVLLLGVLVTHGGGMSELAGRVLVGSAYAIGFAMAILGRTDLFTEYTTIAILPVLTGDSRLVHLARLWGLVYVGNLLGGAAFAVLAVTLAPALGAADERAFVELPAELMHARWWVMLLSASVAGWLMGLLSWLIAGGRDTTSQILFIWFVGLSIGILGLHHVITGGVEVMARVMASGELEPGATAAFFLWTTLGNAAGGLLFAVLVRQGVRIGHKEEHHAEEREGGEKSGRRRSGAADDHRRS